MNKMFKIKPAFLTIIVTAGISTAEAAAIRPDAFFTSNTLSANDDLSTELVSTGFQLNFFGNNHNTLYVNNNGNVTFDSPLIEFTPFGLTATNQEIIAPFFADVDTSAAGLEVTYGTGAINGRNVFGVNWIDVDYFVSDPSHTNRNSFQLLLTDRSDIAAGDFDIEFNYDQIQWESGQASNSDDNGLGGVSAVVGYSNGSGNPGTFFELDGSLVNGTFLDDNILSGLIHNSINSDVDGRYIFEARNGNIIMPPEVPVPAAIWLFGSGIIGLLGIARRRN